MTSTIGQSLGTFTATLYAAQQHDIRNTNTIHTKLAFESLIPKAKFIEVFESVVKANDRFRCHIVLDKKTSQFVWQPLDDFNLDSIIKVVDLSTEESKSIDSARKVAVEAYISSLVDKRFEEKAPLWEAYLFYFPDSRGTSKGSTELLLRINHALGDASSLQQAFKDALQIDPAYTDAFKKLLESEQTSKKDSKDSKTRVESLAVKLKKSLLEVTLTMLYYLEFLFLALRALIPRFHVWMHKMQYEIPTRVAMTTSGFPMEKLKEVGKKNGNATLNDVVLAIVIGAFRRYALEVEKLPVSKIPDLTLGVLVDVRKDLPKEFLKQKMHENLSVPIPVVFNCQADTPIKRLKVVSKAMDYAKAVKRGLALFYLQNFAFAILPRWITLKLFAQSGRAFDLIVTNVKSSPFPMTFAGEKIVDSVGWVPAYAGMGVAAFSSYHGICKFCFLFDSQFVKEPETLRKFIEIETNLIVDATLS